MPLLATVFVIAGLASLGLPTMSGFVAELLVFLGSFATFDMLTTILAVFGILLSAGLHLWTVQRVFFGPRNERWAHLTDATSGGSGSAWPAWSRVIIGVGVYPSTDRRRARERRPPHAGGLSDAATTSNRIGPVLVDERRRGA